MNTFSNMTNDEYYRATGTLSAERIEKLLAPAPTVKQVEKLQGDMPDTTELIKHRQALEFLAARCEDDELAEKLTQVEQTIDRLIDKYDDQTNRLYDFLETLKS